MVSDEIRDVPRTISIPDVSLVLNEIVAVAASMRKQARWSTSTSSVAAILGGAVEANYNDDGNMTTKWGLRATSRTAVNENPMLAGFSKLRHDLLKAKGTAWSILRLSY